MSGLRQAGQVLALIWVPALAGCQSALVEELNNAGTRINQAASAPVVALREVVVDAGDALKGPDLSAAAQQAYADKLAAEALHRLPIITDRALAEHLTGMANRIAAQAPGPRFTYKVYLVDSSQANAFTPGGGYIFVTTALVGRLGSEAQMAMVLGHEIAHCVSGDVVKTAQRREIGQQAVDASRNIFGTKPAVSWIGEGLGMAANAAVNLYTRDQEDHADEAGLDYMVAAGYDLREAEKAIKSLMRGDAHTDDSLLADLFGDHTGKQRRLQRLRNLIVAKYSHTDFSRYVRTTPAYERVSLKYR